MISQTVRSPGFRLHSSGLSTHAAKGLVHPDFERQKRDARLNAVSSLLTHVDSKMGQHFTFFNDMELAVGMHLSHTHH